MVIIIITVITTAIVTGRIERDCVVILLVLIKEGPGRDEEMAVENGIDERTMLMDVVVVVEADIVLSANDVVTYSINQVYYYKETS